MSEIDFAALPPQQELDGLSPAERDAHIALLRQTAAGGRGKVEVKPHAIGLPLLLGLGGIVTVWSSLPASGFFPSLSGFIGSVAGLALIAGSAWALFGPRKPCFTLTEKGVRIHRALLPWESIDDYSVTEHARLGIALQTCVVFEHTGGFTPPSLGLPPLIGATSRNPQTGEYSTHLTLYTGARGMNGDKLADRIAEFLDAAHAREQLAQLKAG